MTIDQRQSQPSVLMNYFMVVTLPDYTSYIISSFSYRLVVLVTSM